MVPGYLERLSRFAPWRNRCLPAAVAAALELRRNGVRSVLVLGVRWNRGGVSIPGSNISAHAWLYVGRSVVCGREGLDEHRALVAWETISN